MEINTSPQKEYIKQIEHLIFDIPPNFESFNFKKENFDINLLSNETGIIIDNGSYECRAGWSICEEPNLRFRSLVAKPKLTDSAISSFVVGNKIFEFEQGKIHKKSPFEKNIVSHFGTQEHIFDHIFSNLNIKDTNVNHPILITEPFANLNFSRKNITELLFECYGAPSICYGIDMLFSLYYNEPEFRNNNNYNGLIISSSFQTTHIVPIFKSRIDLEKSRRISIGSENARDLLMISLHLKYPELKQKFNSEVIQYIYDNYTMTALDYEKQLTLLSKVFKEEQEKYKEFELVNIFGTLEMYHKVMNSIQESNKINNKFSYLKSYTNLVDYIDEKENINNNNNNLINKLIYFKRPAFLAVPILSQEEIKIKEEQKKEQSKRLKEILQKKREETLKNYQNELNSLEKIMQLKDTDKYQFGEALTNSGYENIEEIQKRISKISTKLNNSVQNLDNTKEEDIEKKWPLLSMPDEDLTQEQLKMKRIQKMQKNAYLSRLEKREQIKREKEKIEQLKKDDPEKYLVSLYKTKKEIIDRLNKYQELRKDMMNRHSKSNMKRMQALAELGKEKNDNNSNATSISEDDDFGKNDEDWDAYREVNKNNLSEEEDEETNRLHDIENQIKEMDKDYYKNIQQYQYDFYTKNNSFPLGVDQFRCAELLFKPYIIGVEQAGIIEIISSIFKIINREERKVLSNKIFVTGGNTRYPYLSERIKNDIISNMEYGSDINIKVANDPVLDSWKGARLFFNNNYLNNFKTFFISNKEYKEYGIDYFKENICSNLTINK